MKALRVVPSGKVSIGKSSDVGRAGGSARVKTGARVARPQPLRDRRVMEEPGEPKILLSVEEVAHLLSCGKSLVYRLLRDGELEGMMVGSVRRVMRSSLEAYIVRQRATTARATTRGREAWAARAARIG